MANKKKVKLPSQTRILRAIDEIAANASMEFTHFTKAGKFSKRGAKARAVFDVIYKLAHVGAGGCGHRAVHADWHADAVAIVKDLGA